MRDSNARTRWYAHPTIALTASIILTISGTVCLLLAGKSFGALAFGGANLLALLMWWAQADRMARVCRMQTAGQAAASWWGGIAWTIVVVYLFRNDLPMLGTVAVSVALLLFAVSAWLLDSGRLDKELEEAGRGRGEP